MNDRAAKRYNTSDIDSQSNSHQGQHGLNNVTIVWSAMLCLTVSSWYIGESAHSGKLIIAFVLLTVLVKGHWIISDFMELRHCALKWKLIIYGWMIIVLAVIALFVF